MNSLILDLSKLRGTTGPSRPAMHSALLPSIEPRGNRTERIERPSAGLAGIDMPHKAIDTSRLGYGRSAGGNPDNCGTGEVTTDNRGKGWVGEREKDRDGMYQLVGDLVTNVHIRLAAAPPSRPAKPAKSPRKPFIAANASMTASAAANDYRYVLDLTPSDAVDPSTASGTRSNGRVPRQAQKHRHKGQSYFHDQAREYGAWIDRDRGPRTVVMAGAVSGNDPAVTSVTTPDITVLAPPRPGAKPSIGVSTGRSEALGGHEESQLEAGAEKKAVGEEEEKEEQEWLLRQQRLCHTLLFQSAAYPNEAAAESMPSWESAVDRAGVELTWQGKAQKMRHPAAAAAAAAAAAPTNAESPVLLRPPARLSVGNETAEAGPVSSSALQESSHLGHSQATDSVSVADEALNALPSTRAVVQDATASVPRRRGCAKQQLELSFPCSIINGLVTKGPSTHLPRHIAPQYGHRGGLGAQHMVPGTTGGTSSLSGYARGMKRAPNRGHAIQQQQRQRNRNQSRGVGRDKQKSKLRGLGDGGQSSLCVPAEGESAEGRGSPARRSPSVVTVPSVGRCQGREGADSTPVSPRSRGPSSGLCASGTAIEHFQFEDPHFSPPRTGGGIDYEARGEEKANFHVGESGMDGATEGESHLYQDQGQSVSTMGLLSSSVLGGESAGPTVRRHAGNYHAIFSLFDSGVLSPEAAALARAKRRKARGYSPAAEGALGGGGNSSSSPNAPHGHSRPNGSPPRGVVQPDPWVLPSNTSASRTADLAEDSFLPMPRTAGMNLLQRSTRDRGQDGVSGHRAAHCSRSRSPDGAGAIVNSSNSRAGSSLSPSSGLLNSIRWDERELVAASTGHAFIPFSMASSSDSTSNSAVLQTVLGSEQGPAWSAAQALEQGTASPLQLQERTRPFEAGSRGAAALLAAEEAASRAAEQQQDEQFGGGELNNGGEVAPPLSAHGVLGSRRHQLTDRECAEVLSYRKVYFVGSRYVKEQRMGDKKNQQQASQGAFIADQSQSPALHNFGYDNEKGNYLALVGDHIAYRYEVLGLLGAGSFGDVFRCRDHRSQVDVAVKVVKNQHRFTTQAVNEHMILRAVRRDALPASAMRGQRGLHKGELGHNQSEGSSSECRIVAAPIMSPETGGGRTGRAVVVVPTVGGASGREGTTGSWANPSSGGRNYTHSPNERKDGSQYTEEDSWRVPIVQLYDCFDFRSHVCFVFPLHGPSLYQHLLSRDLAGMPISAIRRVAIQLLQCLSFLREKGIVHCDLKPENILLRDEKRMDIVLIDFGSSCYQGETVYQYVQSRFYRAPEVMLGLPYGCEIDMWSLGCLLPELRTGRPAFAGQNQTDQLDCIREVLGEPPQTMLRSEPKVVADSKAALNEQAASAMFQEQQQNKSKQLVEEGVEEAQEVPSQPQLLEEERGGGGQQLEEVEHQQQQEEKQDIAIASASPVSSIAIAAVDDDAAMASREGPSVPASSPMEPCASRDALSPALRPRSFDSPPVYSSGVQPRPESQPGAPRQPASRSMSSLVNARYRDGALVDFLAACLRWQPDDRLTPDQALKHAWLASAR